MVSNKPLELFPIRELVRRTGVNASTLRAWENRHGILVPTRTPSGHRLYSPADVKKIQRLQELLAQGLSLAEVASVLGQPGMAPASDIQAAPTPPDFGGAPANGAWHGYRMESLSALEDFSTDRLDSLYSEACALYPIDTVTEHLLIPLLEQLGWRWEKRPTGIAEEHFFSAWLRNKLGARLHHAAGIGRGPQVILACLPHENHEIGLLMYALLVLQRGYRVIYLGANMPIRQIVHVARHTHAQAVVLAGRLADDPQGVLQDIKWLAGACTAPVFVGSHFSEQARVGLEQAGAIPLGDNMNLGIRLMDLKLHEAARSAPRT